MYRDENFCCTWLRECGRQPEAEVMFSALQVSVLVHLIDICEVKQNHILRLRLIFNEAKNAFNLSRCALH